MNVLIIGLGSIAQKHINALRSISPNSNIYALRSSTDAEEVAEIQNIYDFFSLDTLLIDFAIVSNPTACHKKTIEALIPFRIPIFIEKPVFDNLDGENLLAEINKSKIITYVACNLRFLGCIKFIKTFIKNKRINEVNCYCGSFLPDWRPGKDFRKIYSANKEMGGGVHIDLIHEIDYIFWLFGPPNGVSVIKSNKSSLNISAIDYANFHFSYPQFSASIILNYYRRDPKRTLEILLDEGTINVDLLKNEVLYNGQVLFSSNNRILDTYEDQLRFFIDKVLNNEEKFNRIDEAFEVLRLCIVND